MNSRIKWSLYLRIAINICDRSDIKLSGPAHSPPEPAPQECTDHLSRDSEKPCSFCAPAAKSSLFCMNRATVSARLADNIHRSFSIVSSGARPRTYNIPGFPLAPRLRSRQNSVRNVIAEVSSSALPGKKCIFVTEKLTLSAVNREVIIVADSLSFSKILLNCSVFASILLLLFVCSGFGIKCMFFGLPKFGFCCLPKSNPSPTYLIDSMKESRPLSKSSGSWTSAKDNNITKKVSNKVTMSEKVTMYPGTLGPCSSVVFALRFNCKFSVPTKQFLSYVRLPGCWN